MLCGLLYALEEAIEALVMLMSRLTVTGGCWNMVDCSTVTSLDEPILIGMSSTSLIVLSILNLSRSSKISWSITLSYSSKSFNSSSSYCRLRIGPPPEGNDTC
jgi:hypothetical protein